MLSFSKVPIIEALTSAPAKKQVTTYDERAVQNFRDLLIWMRDRPSQELQRYASRDAIIGLARTNHALRDEVFLQVMKQLTGNPSVPSSSVGWQLLHLLCVTVLPSDELIRYVKEWLRQVAKGMVGASDADRSEAGLGCGLRKAAGTARGGGGTKAEDFPDSARKCLADLQALDLLPRLAGDVWKKSAGKFRLRAYDWRYASVRNMHLLWWARAADSAAPEASAPDGGPLCKGVVNLLANDCVVKLEKDSKTIFHLVPAKDTTWSEDAREKDKGSQRSFTFDTSGAELDRTVWVDMLNRHIRRARLARAHYEVHERLEPLRYLVSDARSFVEVHWGWAGFAKCAEDDAVETGLAQTLTALEERMASPHAGKALWLRLSANAPGALGLLAATLQKQTLSENLEVSTVYDAVALVSGLIAMREQGANAGFGETLRRTRRVSDTLLGEDTHIAARSSGRKRNLTHLTERSDEDSSSDSSEMWGGSQTGVSASGSSVGEEGGERPHRNRLGTAIGEEGGGGVKEPDVELVAVDPATGEEVDVPGDGPGVERVAAEPSGFHTARGDNSAGRSGDELEGGRLGETGMSFEAIRKAFEQKAAVSVLPPAVRAAVSVADSRPH